MFSSEHLKGLTPFLATADAGSFTKAAERLHLSSSAVSKSVARLEERLGVLLFERSTRRLKLSEAGRAYYATCKRVLQELMDAEDVLADHATELAGKVRIGARLVWPPARDAGPAGTVRAVSAPAAVDRLQRPLRRPVRGAHRHRRAHRCALALARRAGTDAAGRER
jgi:predicted transcriptional regulator